MLTIINSQARLFMAQLRTLLGTYIIFSTLSVGASAATFIVDARANSASGGKPLSTEITVTQGEFLSVTVNSNDLWSAGSLPRWSNADGLIGPLFASGTDESRQIAGTLIGSNFGLFSKNGFQAPFGALVGKIGDTYMLLGTSYATTAPASGILTLQYWDSNFEDNTNSVLVSISTVPEPPTAFILLGGLISIGLYIKRASRSS